MSQFDGAVAGCESFPRSSGSSFVSVFPSSQLPDAELEDVRLEKRLVRKVMAEGPRRRVPTVFEGELSPSMLAMLVFPLNDSRDDRDDRDEDDLTVRSLLVSSSL